MDNVSEKWERWEPINGLSDRYNVKSISNDENGFKVLLMDIKDSKKELSIIFENSVDAYRYTNESFRVATISDISDQFPDCLYSLCKVKNSLYINWLSEQSYTFADAIPFIHFAIIDDDSILDIVTCYEPKVELIELP